MANKADQIMEWRGYSGSTAYSVAYQFFHGRILNIKDLVTYEAETSNALVASFRNAVNDYIGTTEIKNPPLTESDVRRIVREELHAPTFGTWQPIETAPRDGTKILCYRKGDIRLVWWVDLPGVFNWRSGALTDYPSDYFTHWMPQPDKPREDK